MANMANDCVSDCAHAGGRASEHDADGACGDVPIDVAPIAGRVVVRVPYEAQVNSRQ